MTELQRRSWARIAGIGVLLTGCLVLGAGFLARRRIRAGEGALDERTRSRLLATAPGLT